METTTLLIGFFAFVLVSVASIGYIFMSRQEKPAEQENQEGASLISDPGADRTDLVSNVLQALGGKVGPKGDRDPSRRLLVAAGYRYPSAVTIFSGIKAAAALILGLVLGIISLSSQGDPFIAIVAAICGGGFGYLLPDRILERKAKSRAVRIRYAIPAALDLMVLSVEAGQSLNQALYDTSQELREAFPDLSSELAQSYLELRAGQSRGQALFNLGDRVREPELRKLANVLIDADRFGTSLGPALRTHAKYLRTRSRQMGQEEARKVTVKLIFPVFFLIFPAVLVVTLGPAVLKLTMELKKFVGE